MPDINALAKSNGPNQESERMAYTRWFNYILAGNKDVDHLIPISLNNDEFYDKLSDGIILVEILNYLFPSCISRNAVHYDRSSLPRHKKFDNLCLVIVTASCYGCSCQHLDVYHVISGVKIAILDLVWQILRVGFTYNINIQNYPDLILLKKSNESINDLRSISSTELVLRYINYYLTKPNFQDVINDFSDDLSDGSIYSAVVFKIVLGQTKTDRNSVISESLIYNENNVNQRLQNAIKVLNEHNLGYFISNPDDFDKTDPTKLVSIYKFNFLTFHLIFKAYRLSDIKHDSMKVYKEYNQEKYMRNFINSFGVDPYCNDLSPNLRNSLLIIQVIETIDEWAFKNVDFIKTFIPEYGISQRVHNSCYTLAKLDEYNVQPRDIYPEHVALACKKSITEMIFNIMNWWFERTILKPKTVLKWVNHQINKDNLIIYSFRDITIIKEHLFALVLDKCVDKPIVNYQLKDEMTKMEFIQYYVTLARRCGYQIFTLPEQFASCEYEPVFMAFATLMYDKRHESILCKNKVVPN